MRLPISSYDWRVRRLLKEGICAGEGDAGERVYFIRQYRLYF